MFNSSLYSQDVQHNTCDRNSTVFALSTYYMLTSCQTVLRILLVMNCEVQDNWLPELLHDIQASSGPTCSLFLPRPPFPAFPVTHILRAVTSPSCSKSDRQSSRGHLANSHILDKFTRQLITTGCTVSGRDYFNSKKDLNLKQVLLTCVCGRSEWVQSMFSHFFPGGKIHIFYQICYWSLNQKRLKKQFLRGVLSGRSSCVEGSAAVQCGHHCPSVALEHLKCRQCK